MPEPAWCRGLVLKDSLGRVPFSRHMLGCDRLRSPKTLPRDKTYPAKSRCLCGNLTYEQKTNMITGAGSGFGESAAIGLAQNGHEVIAGVQIWPQVTSLRQKVKSIGLSDIRVEKLDLLHPYDVANALKWDIDILFSNAGIGENGPVCEIPVDLVRRTFEVNVFAPLELAQKFIRKWVDEKRPGKVVCTSSVAGLVSPLTGLAPYFASKHALQCIAESLQEELKPFNIQVQTMNPGPS